MTATSFDSATVAAFQMTGQDVPWLLDHWATNKPDHPFLIWEPRDGNDRTWTYAAFLAEASASPPGSAPRHRQGRQGADPLRELPRDGARVVRLRAARRGRGDHQHQERRRRGRRTSPSTPRCVAAITQPQYAAMVAASGAGAEVDRGHRRQQRRARRRRRARDDGAERIAFADAVRRRRGAARARRRADAAGRDHVHVGHDVAPEGGRAHPRQRDLGQPRSGPTTSTSRRRPYLIYLPFFHVNAQSWAIWSVLGVGATVVLHAEVVAEPLLGLVAKHGVTHISLHAVRDGGDHAASRSRGTHAARSACSG